MKANNRAKFWELVRNPGSYTPLFESRSRLSGLLEEFGPILAILAVMVVTL